MKILVLTDLEGITGIYNFNQTRIEVLESKELLMADINACIKGLKKTNVNEIEIYDGHGASNENGNFLPHLMIENITYISGNKKKSILDLLDTTYDGVILLGHHAMMGTKNGVLHHTQNSVVEKRYWYNNIESGEIAQEGIIAGYFNVPVIMVTGDDTTCKEAHDFLGSEITTVAVKEGISREEAKLYPLSVTKKLITEGTINAIKNIKNCKPYKPDMPIKGRFTDKTGIVLEKVFSKGMDVRKF